MIAFEGYALLVGYHICKNQLIFAFFKDIFVNLKIHMNNSHRVIRIGSPGLTIQDGFKWLAIACPLLVMLLIG